jgi:hypothetical protein
MFSIEQVDDLHDRLDSAKTLPEYVLALKALGIEQYDSYLADGHSAIDWIEDTAARAFRSSFSRSSLISALFREWLPQVRQTKVAAPARKNKPQPAFAAILNAEIRIQALQTKNVRIAIRFSQKS